MLILRRLSLCIVIALFFCAPAGAAGIHPVADGNNAFAMAIYRQVAAKPSDANIVISPYSISTALAMTYAGARGRTATQMASALHFILPDRELHPGFAALAQGLQAEAATRPYQLLSANALWGQHGLEVRPAFREITDRHYAGGYRSVDFAGDTEGSRRTINAWVEEKTRTLIKDLLGRGDVTELTRLVLTNAIYFKGVWLRPFATADTRSEPFSVAPGKTKMLPMMRQAGVFSYGTVEGAQVLELPYAGEDLAMLLILPEGGVAQAEQILARRGLAGLRADLRERDLDVIMPRFKFAGRFGLGPGLQQLGMIDAFDQNAADFSGISPTFLYISAVIHQACIEVNEQGTEAAAATVVVMGTKSIQRRPVFRADRPFVFTIFDKATHSILFMGRVMDPNEA